MIDGESHSSEIQSTKPKDLKEVRFLQSTGNKECTPFFESELQRFERIQQERRSNRGVARSINLYPPGRIVHLVKTGQSKNCLHGVTGCITCGLSNAGFEYTAIRKENDDFNEIEISPTLWTDHFPNRVCTEIEKVAKSFGIET